MTHWQPCCHTCRRPEKERRSRLTRTSTALRSALCQKPTLSKQSTAVAILRPKQKSIAGNKECPASGIKLETAASWVGTLAKHIPDRPYSRLKNTELLRNDKNLSIETSINVHVNHTPSHFLFLTVTKPRELLPSRRHLLSAICIHEKLPSTTKTTKILILEKPTYKSHVSYRVPLQIIHTVLCLFDTGAQLNLANNLLISPEWNHCFHRRKIPNLRSATKQLFHMDGKILLHVRLGTICVRVRFDIVSSLAVDIVLRSSTVLRVAISPPSKTSCPDIPIP